MNKSVKKIYMGIPVLIAIVAIAEYEVMSLFHFLQWDTLLSDGIEAIVDSLLLITFSAFPTYWLVIKPLLKTTQQQQQKLSNLVEALDGAGEGVIITDNKGVINYVNKSFMRVTGFTPEEAICHTPKMLQSGKHSKAFYTMMWRSIREKGAWEGEV